MRERRTPSVKKTLANAVSHTVLPNNGIRSLGGLPLTPSQLRKKSETQSINTQVKRRKLCVRVESENKSELEKRQQQIRLLPPREECLSRLRWQNGRTPLKSCGSRAEDSVVFQRNCTHNDNMHLGASVLSITEQQQPIRASHNYNTLHEKPKNVAASHVYLIS